MSEAPFQADQGGDLFPELNEARATISKLNDTRALELRIEALRAAARIAAKPDATFLSAEGQKLPIDTAVLGFAKQFAKWLETGE